MTKTYVDYVCDYIVEQEVGKPIYISRMSEHMACAYNMPKKKAAGAVSVACKRILDNGLVPELRAFQKGILYRAAATPFGETGIDREQLITDKYLLNDNGYETGLFVLYQLGLTTQLPRERVLVTNRARDCARVDKKLGVTIRPPKIKITADNKQYLKTLDVLDILKDAPVDIDNPYVILSDYIRKMELEYHMLLALADHYYNKQTILQLAHVAGGNL